jgi:DNA invertase Pin-like site-specific DNA recombinase
MLHLVATVHELAQRGVGFKSLAESIDTTSAAGRLVLHVFAALADFERDLIRERTRDALAAKKRRGEPVGRRRALNASRLEAARSMLAEGKGPAQVARILQVDRSTLYRALKGAAA